MTTGNRRSHFVSRTSSQYARALFEVCRTQDVIDRVAGEIEVVVERAKPETAVRKLLFHPEIPIRDKRALLRQLLPEDLSSETKAFLDLLLEHRLFELLPEIHQAFLALRRESFGVLTAVVETALPLSRRSKEQLTAALETASGRSVVVVEEPNPALIGGLRVRVGDRVIDGSVAGRLNRIREQIVGAAGGER